MIDALNSLQLVLMGCALVGGCGAIFSRSLFAGCMHLTAVGASVAALILLLGAADGALALALFAAAWAPVLLLGAMVISARAAKTTTRGVPYVSLLAAAAALVGAWWPLSEIIGQDAISEQAPVAITFWLAPLLLVIAVACVGLLGYGERGAFENGERS